MADATAADRQRRYRQRQAAHKAGDHRFCVPTSCDLAPIGGESSPTRTVTPSSVTASRDTVTQRAPDLGSRGRRLWQQVTEDSGELRPGERVLLEEACRTADRLDQLDRILRGDEDAWMRLKLVSEDGSVVQVVLNNVLAEARQQQVALKQLLAELRQSRGGGAAKPGRGGQRQPSTGAPKGGGGVADLTARIAARQGAAG